MKCQQVNVSRKILFCLVLLFLGLMSASVTHAETYNFVKKWGSQGNVNESQIYSFPRSIAVDSSGNVYVALLVNNRIEKFDSNGTFLTKLGSYGTGNGQFEEPEGVAVDSSGNVYVADLSNYRIEKFNSTGGYLTQWVCNGSGYEHIYGHYSCTCGIAVDSLGNVYVDNPHNSLIQKFNSNGGCLTQWGSLGTGNGQFNGSIGVAVDSSGNVYVADQYNNRIQKFDSNGGYLTQWGSSGSGNGQFNNPYGVAVDSSDNVYVADENNNRIQKFDSSGNFITQWGSYGTGNGQFGEPFGVAVDTSGNVYVIDDNILCIQKFAPNVSKSTTNFTDFPSIIVPVVAMLVLTVIFRRKKW
jgi:DNA-binding beta-propeller fold protein YncE